MTISALLGNSRAVASVDADGAVAWLALPDASASPVFDRHAPAPAQAGHFWLTAPHATSVKREYVGTTSVLQTLYETPEGTAMVIDFLPLRWGPNGQVRVAHPRLVRVVEGLKGKVDFAFECAPMGPGSAAGRPELVLDPNGVLFQGTDRALLLQTEADVHRDRHSVAGHFSVGAEEKRHFVLTMVEGSDPDVPELRATEPAWDLDGTFDYWIQWARRCPFQGVQRDLVVKLAAYVQALWLPPALCEGRLPLPGDRRELATFCAAAPVALAAWGWPETLDGLLTDWPGSNLARQLPEASALALAWLAEGNRSGTIEANALPGVWGAWRPMVEAMLRQDGGSREQARGLAGAAALADDLMLEGDHAAWGSAAEARLAAAPPARRLDDEATDRVLAGGELAGCIEAIEAELEHGAYLQARRRMDRWLQAFDPLAAGAAPLTAARALFTAARIYLVEPPAPSRVDMPGDLGT